VASFGHEGGTSRLTAEQQDKLKTWIGVTLPGTTREVGAWIAREARDPMRAMDGGVAKPSIAPAQPGPRAVVVNCRSILRFPPF
jgi:hypothetical protein